MELKAIIVFFPLGFVYISMGVLINTIQAACFLLIRPLSRAAYRRIVGVATEILFFLPIWFMEWWSGFEVHLHTDSDTYQLMGKEHAILMPNHISDADILIILLLAQRCNCLHSALMVVKKSSMFIPIHGYATWFNEYVFLSRSWEKDEKTLKESFQGLQDFPRPFWLTIFVEGTRMTPDKLVAAQEFAISRGLPVPRNVMIPRTKGFVAAVQQMRSFVPAVYDITLVVSRGHRTPSLLEFVKGRPTSVQIHLKRYSMKELPNSDEGVAQWCRERFVAKDAMLDEFQAKGTFGSDEIRNVGRSKKALIVFISAACMCSLMGITLIQRFSLLSTWKGVISLATGLALHVIFWHGLIEYTKLPSTGKVSIGDGRVKLRN